jgi:hypothetical protein
LERGQKAFQYAAVTALVTAMEGLPLALDQAGAYIEETQRGLPMYLELFQTQRALLLQHRGEEAREHPESVSTTFTLAIAATKQKHSSVLDLLYACAFLQADAIPEDLFHLGAQHFEAPFESVCHDPLAWNRVIAIACSYSLVSRESELHVLAIHRLLQAVLLDAMTVSEQESWNRRILRALECVFPEVGDIPI